MTRTLALERLRAALLADEALQSELGEIEEDAGFAAHAEGAAQARDIGLSRDEVLGALRAGATGIARGPAEPATDRTWPPRRWLPVRAMAAHDGGFCIDWRYFGAHRLTEPFFELCARPLSNRPLNRLFPIRTRLDDFFEQADTRDSLAPAGFIFHMSRCGSTLVAQMLAAQPEHVVVAEAPPLDEIVQLNVLWPAIAEENHARLIALMVAALGRRRCERARRYFVKLDSWHTLALPVFRRAFPTTPCVFLYRDPIEVLVSQMRQRGLQTVPGAIPARLFGIASDGPPEDYCARVLARVCAAAIANFAPGLDLCVNYDELPDAMWTRILPHFGIDARDVDSAAMGAAAGRDAKSPALAFAADGESKRRAASPAVRAAAETHLAAVYRELERLRSQR